MTFTRLELPFKATAVIVAPPLIALVLLFISDRVPGLSELFNAHSSVGGAFILFLVATGGVCSVGLAFVLPWAVVTFCRHPDARTLLNAFLLLAGALSLALMGWWLLQVARH